MADMFLLRPPAIRTPVPRLHARRFVQKMRGGSQAALIETGEGSFVVKWVQNAQHRRVLINEAVCSELLKRLGVASPLWAWIHVDRAFLRDNPEVRIVRQLGYTAIEPGWHFGSGFPASQDHKAVYDVLPSSIIDKVSNRWDFLKILVFDMWVDNRDLRQAIFFHSLNRGLRVEMIDHGNALGFDGVEWCSSGTSLREPYPGTRALHASIQAPKHYARTIAAIGKVTRDDLAQLLNALPPEWIENDGALISRQFDRLIDRALRLADSMADAQAHLHNATDLA
jgi:hypothetical protein